MTKSINVAENMFQIIQCFVMCALQQPETFPHHVTISLLTRMNGMLSFHFKYYEVYIVNTYLSYGRSQIHRFTSIPIHKFMITLFPGVMNLFLYFQLYCFHPNESDESYLNLPLHLISHLTIALDHI